MFLAIDDKGSIEPLLNVQRQLGVIVEGEHFALARRFAQPELKGILCLQVGTVGFVDTDNIDVFELVTGRYGRTVEVVAGEDANELGGENRYSRTFSERLYDVYGDVGTLVACEQIAVLRVLRCTHVSSSFYSWDENNKKFVRIYCIIIYIKSQEAMNICLINLQVSLYRIYIIIDFSIF